MVGTAVSLPVHSPIVTNAVNVIASVIMNDTCLYIKILTTKKYIWVLPKLVLVHLFVLELHEHLTKEHAIGDDNRVQDMRRIGTELLESRNLQTGNRDFLVSRS